MIQGEARASRGGRAPAGEAARRRAAVEMVSRYERSLKRTARRYSLDAEDVEDAFQRTLEIVLTKAPTSEPGELIRWTQTVIKHEALAVRRQRERLLGVTPTSEKTGLVRDAIELLPARGEGPEAEVERREEVGRTREALRALKPAELRALTLLAEGYSYAEISEITGFSLTKVNRSLAEGRERFRAILCSSESGERCRQLRPLISVFCDGEASAKDAELVREHLRACPHCRATMRAYRTAPGLAAALVPALPVPGGLLGRAHGLLSRFGAHLATAKQVGGCAAVVGVGAIGVVTGVLPNPVAAGVEGPAAAPKEMPATTPGSAPPPGAGRTTESRRVKVNRRQRPNRVPTEERSAEPDPTEAVEYEAPVEAPPETSPPPTPEPSGSSGSAAGEFGP